MMNATRQFHPTSAYDRPPIRRRPSTIVLVLAGFFTVVLTVGGCNSANPDPTDIDQGKTVGTSATPTTTPPAISTPSPTKVYKPASASGPAENVPVPVLPAAAKEFSKKGLEEFARYWYSTLGYAYETGDMKPMMAVTDPACVTCANVKSTVTGWHQKGRWIVGGQMNVLSSDSKFVLTPDGTYQAIVFVKQNAVSFYQSDGKLDTALGQDPATADIVVATYENGRWIASTAEHLSKD
jgi:hypothetical protein